MSDYISREDALECVTYDVEYTTEQIKGLPSADVVPVVRCKDCKHLDVRTAGWGICKDANGCGRLCGPNDFCSSGVRKE